MTCREFTDFIMAYVSDEIPSDDRARFEHHLQECVNCERYLAAYRETVRLGQRAFDDDAAELPADVPDELVKAILAFRRQA